MEHDDNLTALHRSTVKSRTAHYRAAGMTFADAVKAAQIDARTAVDAAITSAVTA